MTNLPHSTGSGDLDNLSVTRAEFRSEIGELLEYLAQALGDVTGNYTDAAVSPTAVVLQGTPTIEVGANPPTADKSQRIPSTDWVKESGRYVGNAAPAAPVDGMLWIDNSSSPYELKTYNNGNTDWDLISGIPSGTRMLFQQSSAPTGWTKVTTGVNNMALRVVTGNTGIVSSEQPFSSVFTSKTTSGTVQSHTLTNSEMPYHSHGGQDTGHSHSITTSSLTGGFNPGTHADIGATGVFRDAGNIGSREGHDARNGRRVEMNASHAHSCYSSKASISISGNGGSRGHSHGYSGGSLNLKINYVDVIVAQKD